MGTRAETTRKEKAILKFIEEQVIENGYPPSVREIGKSNWIKFYCDSTCLFSKTRKTRIHKKRR